MSANHDPAAGRVCAETDLDAWGVGPLETTMKMKLLLGCAMAAAIGSGVMASGVLDRLDLGGFVPGSAQAAEPARVAASQPQALPSASWKQVFDFARARR